jgi:hypothetical protein
VNMSIYDASSTAETIFTPIFEWRASPAVRPSNCDVRLGCASPAASRVGPVPGTIFAGIVVYFDALPSGSAAAQIIVDARSAWPAPWRTVVWPRREDVEMLDPGPRSVDFGRNDTVCVQAAPDGVLGAHRGGLWRDGRSRESDLSADRYYCLV